MKPAANSLNTILEDYTGLLLYHNPLETFRILGCLLYTRFVLKNYLTSNSLMLVAFLFGLSSTAIRMMVSRMIPIGNTQSRDSSL